MRKRLISLCTVFALLAGLVMPNALAKYIGGDEGSRDIAVILDGTSIGDGLEFPADHTVTINTTAPTVITGNVFFTGSVGRQELIFTGNAPLEIKGDIMTGNNGDSVTVKEGANVIVTGSVSTGGSGNVGGFLIATEGGHLTFTQSEFGQSVDHLILNQGASITMHRTLSPHSELVLGEDTVLEINGHGNAAIAALSGNNDEQTEEYRKEFEELMKGILPPQYRIGEYVRAETGMTEYTVLDENDIAVEHLILRGPSSAPKLTEGKAERSSETTAQATFQSDKNGTYYYIVAEPGAPKPDSIPESEASHSLAEGENGIGLDALTAGEKRLYIQAVNDVTGKKSEILTITIPAFAPEEPAIQLTGGKAERSSETAARAAFQSDKDGTYYYIVAEPDAPKPDSVVGSGTHANCQAGENRIELDHLTAGEKRLYIQAVDAAGKNSGILEITIPAYDGTDEPEEPAIQLTEGKAERSSETAARAAFQSDKDGTYYYIVAEPDAPKPDSVVGSGTHANCQAGENRIELDHLTAGEKRLYIQAVDAAGKNSGILEITIPAYDGTDEPEKPIIRLTAGEAVRSSAAAAEVGFSSSAAGTYYYAVCAKGEDAPADLTVGTGHSCASGGNQILLSGLDEEEQVIYIQAVTAEGTKSNLLQMRIPAYQQGGDDKPGDEKPNGGFPSSSGASHAKWTFGGSKSETVTYPIWIAEKEGGEVEADHKRASAGTAIRVTAGPDDGYTLDSITVTDSRGNPIRTSGSEGRYTFTMPASEVTVSGVFRENQQGHTACPLRAFSDLDEGQWYHEAIDYVLEKGMMHGTGAGFSPDAPLSRAMLVQILYQCAGRPQAAQTAAFADVPAGEWYADAIAWAVSAGIAEGGSDGQFHPNGSLSREEIAVMLWRCAGSPKAAAELPFADTGSVSAFALDALRWAVGSGIMSGKDGNRLDPAGLTTRAEAAQLLKNAGLKS